MTAEETVVAIVQARVSSSRFPGKVLADVEGAPLLARLLRRLLHSRECGAVAVATSTAPEDDAVAAIAASEGVASVRGPLDDVLERYRLAAERLDADIVVRVTGDCPLLDPALVDAVVRRFRETGVDYASNIHPPTFPDGLDVEVVSRAALERAAREARRPSEREHVTLYIAEREDIFSHTSVTGDPNRSAMRWTVDHPEDLAFVRAVFRTFRGREESFSAADLVAAVESESALRALMPDRVRNEGLLISRERERD